VAAAFRLTKLSRAQDYIDARLVDSITNKIAMSFVWAENAKRHANQDL